MFMEFESPTHRQSCAYGVEKIFPPFHDIELRRKEATGVEVPLRAPTHWV